jgi:hypothetical protein
VLVARHIAWLWVINGRKLVLDTYLEALSASQDAPLES